MAEKDGKDPVEKIVRAHAPEELEKKVWGPHNRAYEKFEKGKDRVASRQEFNELLKSYMQHHYKELYNAELPEEKAVGEAINILNAMEDEGGYPGFLQRAQTGEAGGARAAIEALRDALRGQHQRQYTTHHIHKHLPDPSDYDAQIKVAKKLLDTYKKFLPEDVKTKSTEQLLAETGGLDNLVSSYLNAARRQRALLEKRTPDDYKAGMDKAA